MTSDLSSLGDVATENVLYKLNETPAFDIEQEKYY